MLGNPTIPAGQSAPDPTGAAVTALEVTITDGSLGLGDGAENFVAVTGITGTLLVFDSVAAQQSTASATPTVTLNGVVGQLSGTVALQNVTGVSFGATMSADVQHHRRDGRRPRHPAGTGRHAARVGRRHAVLGRPPPMSPSPSWARPSPAI